MKTKTLKVLRAENNITQKEFAKSLGVSTYSVGRWDKDITKMTAKNLVKICTTYNVSAHDLLGI